MLFSPDRLFVLALVITLVSADGVYRAWRQRAEETIGPRLFGAYLAALLAGVGLVWYGFLIEWLGA